MELADSQLVFQPVPRGCCWMSDHTSKITAPERFLPPESQAFSEHWPALVSYPLLLVSSGDLESPLTRRPSRPL